MGLLYDDIIKDIAKSTNKTDSEVKKMFEKAGVETVNNDNRLHIQTGKSPLDIRQSDLEKLNAKDIKYNGKMYSEYEISQMLRKKEREICALKREAVAYKTALSETDEKEFKTVFQSALTYTNSVIRNKSNQIQEFCNQTGYKRDRFREQVGGKTSVGHTSKNRQTNLNFNKNDGNINLTEMFRAKDTSRKDYKIISEDTFNKLTIQAKKNGAIILRGTDEIEKHLNDILMFRRKVCLNEVLEETYYFMQNKARLNDDKPEPLRTYLNEIDAKQYLINDTNKFKIPRI